MLRYLGQGDGRPLAFSKNLPEDAPIAVEDFCCLKGFSLAGAFQLGDAGLNLSRPIGVDKTADDGRPAEDQHGEQEQTGE
jgi:hypothetical protein